MSCLINSSEDIVFKISNALALIYISFYGIVLISAPIFLGGIQYEMRQYLSPVILGLVPKIETERPDYGKFIGFKETIIPWVNFQQEGGRLILDLSFKNKNKHMVIDMVKKNGAFVLNLINS